MLTLNFVNAFLSSVLMFKFSVKIIPLEILCFCNMEFILFIYD